VNIQTAQKWYCSATEEFTPLCTQREPSRLYLEVFVRGVTATLFGKDGRSDFPETLYLDSSRLQIIKAEIEDDIFFEVCLEMFAGLLKQFGYQGPSLSTTRQQLVSSLTAIMGETSVGYGPLKWMANSEALSLEVLRQATTLAGRPTTYDYENMSSANQHLRHLFFSTFTTQARNLEAVVLPMIMTIIEKHANSSPMELFNNLISTTTTPTLLSKTHISQPVAADTFSSTYLPHLDVRKLSDIANRISHIIILHWRIWGNIVYVQDDAAKSSSAVTSTTLTPDAQVPCSMRTGEPADSGSETHVAHETSSQ
jgi:hypothetical protein